MIVHRFVEPPEPGPEKDKRLDKCADCGMTRKSNPHKHWQAPGYVHGRFKGERYDPLTGVTEVIRSR